MPDSHFAHTHGLWRIKTGHDDIFVGSELFYLNVHRCYQSKLFFTQSKIWRTPTSRVFFINLCVHYGTYYRVELLIWIHIFCALGFVSPSVSRCLFVCYRSWCVTWLTNTTSATWHTARNLQSLNHAASGDYVHTLAHTHTHTHTNGSSRIHFGSRCRVEREC